VERAEELCRQGNVRMIALTHISNSLGCINPIKYVCQTAKKYGAVTLIDAAKVRSRAFDVEDIGCDFLAFSSHKLRTNPYRVLNTDARSCSNSMEPYQTGVRNDCKRRLGTRAKWKPRTSIPKPDPHSRGLSPGESARSIWNPTSHGLRLSDHFLCIGQAAERYREPVKCLACRRDRRISLSLCCCQSQRNDPISINSVATDGSDYSSAVIAKADQAPAIFGTGLEPSGRRFPLRLVSIYAYNHFASRLVRFHGSSTPASV